MTIRDAVSTKSGIRCLRDRWRDIGMSSATQSEVSLGRG
jgi:hypothetical protein